MFIRNLKYVIYFCCYHVEGLLKFCFGLLASKELIHMLDLLDLKKLTFYHFNLYI